MAFYEKNDGFLRIISLEDSSMPYILRVENSQMGSHTGSGLLKTKLNSTGDVIQLFADLAIETLPGSFLTFRQDTTAKDFKDTVDVYFMCPAGSEPIVYDPKWHHQTPNNQEFYYVEFTISGTVSTSVQLSIGSGISTQELINKFYNQINGF